MKQVTYFIKKPTGKGENKEALIILQSRYKGQRLAFSTGLKIPPDKWNIKKQRVKDTYKNHADLNSKLSGLERCYSETFEREVLNGTPNPETLKKALYEYLNPPGFDAREFFGLAERFERGEITNGKELDKSPHTLKGYKTLVSHLLDFQRDKRFPISFNTFTLEFSSKYKQYLSNKKKLSHNSIAKDFRILKTFLNYALVTGLTSNMAFKNPRFGLTENETESTYLTEKEILKLFNHNFSNKPKLERVRDLFVFGCFTGLRFSDFSKVKPENITEIDNSTFIRLKTQKTKEPLIIPAHPVILQIFDRYKDNPNKLPRAISNQPFNNYLKIICKEAGLTEKGRLFTNPDKQLFELITSHTARRSFATNLYLQGFPVIDLMRITGHKKETTLLNYIKVSKLDTAKRLAAHMANKWENKLYKVA